MSGRPRRARASVAKQAVQAKGKPGATTKNLNDAKWKTSNAKTIMAQCFIDGIIPLDEEIPVDSKDACDNLFKNHPDFKDFPYDKDIYDGRLGRLRHAINQKQHWADMDAVALIKDRQVYPVRTHNAKGEINWKGSEADFWLKKDMEKKKHRKMKPEALRATRPCYQLFSKKRFSKRIDQLLEDEKDFGVTPGQDKSKAKKKHNPRKFGDPTKSLLLSDNAVAALNDGGDDESSNLTDSDASDSDGESDV